jgi:hypothetical protein
MTPFFPSRRSRLKTWLKHTWLSRLSLRGWFEEWSARFARPRNRTGPPLTFRPEVMHLEPRFAPDEPFGFLQGAVLGTGLLSPSVALLAGRADALPNRVQLDTAAVEAQRAARARQDVATEPAARPAVVSGDPRPVAEPSDRSRSAPEAPARPPAPVEGAALRSPLDADPFRDPLDSDWLFAVGGPLGQRPPRLDGLAAPEHVGGGAEVGEGGSVGDGGAAAHQTAAPSALAGPPAPHGGGDPTLLAAASAAADAQGTAPPAVSPAAPAAADAQGTAPPAAPPTAPPPAHTALAPNYGKLPLAYEPNVGQATDAGVRFLSHGPGFELFLTANAAVFSMARPGDHSTRDAFRLSFDGANPSPQVSGQQALGSRSNYFIGRDPRSWHADVPQYGQVQVRGLYPGVDLVYHGAGGGKQLEFDLVVNPGADPSSIRLSWQGLQSVQLDSRNNLLLRTAGGTVTQQAPVLYQELNGQRQPVSGQHTLLGGGRVGFQVGSYDHTRPLVIDPSVLYSTYLGGSGDDYATGLAVDAAGDAYVVGNTSSPDFPTTMGAYQTSPAPLFVTKLNSAGTALVYSTFFGSSTIRTTSAAAGIAINASGEAYLIGSTSATDFPVTQGAYQTVNDTRSTAAFVARLSRMGDQLLYGTYLGHGPTHGAAVAVDAGGSAYVTGDTAPLLAGQSPNFPTTAGAFQTAWGGGTDAFVTKLTPDGSGLAYSSYLGGSNTDYGHGITLDDAGEAFVTGGTTSPDFPTTPGAFETDRGQGFVVKVNAGGTALLYSTRLGGHLNPLQPQEHGNAIAVDRSGFAYVAGQTASRDFPTTPGALQPGPGGGAQDWDAFVAKLNPGGTGLAYGTYLGGGRPDYAYGIAVDAAGTATVVGSTSSNNFPTHNPLFGYSDTPENAGDAFIAQLTPDGSALSFGTYLGGTQPIPPYPVKSDGAIAVALDAAGNVYVAGNTNSIDFPTTSGAYQSMNQGGYSDAFVTKVSACGQGVTTTNPGDQSNVEGQAVSLAIQASDPDGLPLSYLARGLPGGLSINPTSGVISGTVAPGDADHGPYAVTVTASDSMFGASQNFNWAVSPRVNWDPIPDQSNLEGDQVSLATHASESGATLSYTAGGLPPGLHIDSGTGLISGAIATGAAGGGPYHVTVTAGDGTYSASQLFQWSVAVPLTLPLVQDQSNGVGDTVRLPLNAVDNRGLPLSYLATGLPDGLSVDGSGVISGRVTVSAAVVGVHAVTVTANDSLSSVSQSFNWSISPVGLSKPPDRTNLEGTPVSLQLSATTLSGVPAYLADNLPPGLTLDPASGQIAGTLQHPVDSTYQVTVTAWTLDGSDSQTFNWTVTPQVQWVNPGDQINVAGDSVTLPLQASDAHGAPLTYQATGLPGGLSIDPQGGVIHGTIDPGAARPMPYVVTVQAGDGTYQDSTSFDWTVAAPDPTPPLSAGDATFSVSACRPTTVPAAGVLVHSTGPDGLQPARVSGPTHGMLTLQPDGSFTYAPDPSFAGRDQFTFQVQAGTQLSNVATATLLAGPVAQDGSYSVQHDQPLAVDATEGVLSTASDADGLPLQAVPVGTAQYGTVTLYSDGSFDYRPPAGFVGTDSFQYQVTAGMQTSNVATVRVNVVDQAPNAPDTSYSVHAGQTLQVNAPGLADVASDPDREDTLSFAVDSGSGPYHGQLQFASDGTFTYQPNPGFTGTDTFRYHTNDGALNSPTSGTVTIHVNDQAPQAGDVSFDVAAGGVLNDPTKNVLAQTSAPDDDPVTAQLVNGPREARQFTLNSDGTFVYAPVSGFTGTDSFTFTASDGTLSSNTATVTLQVSDVAFAHDHYYLLPPSGGLTVSAADGVLADAFNPTAGSVRAVLVRPASSGTVDLHSDGSFVYAPAGGPPAADVTFGYTIPLPDGTLNGPVAQAVLVAAQPRVQLLSEKFTKGIPAVGRIHVVRAITPDSGGDEYPTSWSSTAASTRNPLALFADAGYSLVATFSVDRPELFKQAIDAGRLAAVGSNGWLAPALRGARPRFIIGRATGTLTAVWDDVPATAKASVNDTVDQQWSLVLTLGGGAAVVPTSNTALHQIYVMASLVTRLDTIYHTVARVGTLAAAGLSSFSDAEADKITDNIMKAFETRNITRAEKFAPTDKKLPVLTYYGKWTVLVSGMESRTTDTLLKTGDGSCDAWVKFFFEVLRCQGIYHSDDRFYAIRVDPALVPTLPTTQPVLLVKNWTPTGRDAINTYPIAGGPVNFNRKRYNWRSAEVTKPEGAGIPGQGGTDPLAVFDSHAIALVVLRSGAALLFDPSYGRRFTGATPADRLKAWQNGSLDFVGGIEASATPGIRRLKLTAITARTNRLYIQRFLP